MEPGGEEAERLEALRQSDKARLEILCDVLSKHLGLETTLKRSPVILSPAYFLGNHEVRSCLMFPFIIHNFLSLFFIRVSLNIST